MKTPPPPRKRIKRKHTGLSSSKKIGQSEYDRQYNDKFRAYCPAENEWHKLQKFITKTTRQIQHLMKLVNGAREIQKKIVFTQQTDSKLTRVKI